MIEPGAKIAAKYRVIRMLGEGGMGHVFEAEHEALGTRVAIKVLKDEVLKDEEAVTRFAREARAAAVLTGPHATRILDVGQADTGQPFIVMELLEGNDLDAELEKRGQIPVLEAVEYVLQACDAMAEAHARGIVHRDLKPSNLFLARQNDRRIIKLLDFGISRIDGLGTRVTQTQTAFGTPLYMSPEAMRSAKFADARSDVWSFGVILYELIAGLPPFIGDSATSVAIAVTVERPKSLNETRPEVSPELDAVIMRAMEKDVALRFQNADELRRALRAAMGGVAPSAFDPRESSQSLRAARPAVAKTQRDLGLVTQTPAPFVGGARVSPKSRLAVLLGGALAAFALTIGVFWVVRYKISPNASAATRNTNETRAAQPAELESAPKQVQTGPSVAPVIVDLAPPPSPEVTSSASASASGSTDPTSSAHPEAARPHDKPAPSVSTPAPSSPPSSAPPATTPTSTHQPGGSPMRI